MSGFSSRLTKLCSSGRAGLDLASFAVLGVFVLTGGKEGTVSWNGNVVGKIGI